VQEQLAAVTDGRADAAIAGISMTAEREEQVDFSYPYFDAGLQVLASDSGDVSRINIVQSYTSVALMQIVLLGLVVCLVLAHVIWLLERRANPTFQRGYLRGVWEGLWWLASVISTGEFPAGSTGDYGPLRRFLTVGLWLFGVVFIAQFTAIVTADLTVDQMNDSVDGLQDLPGKQVVTVQGSTAASWTARNGLEAVELPRIEDAYDKLKSGDADAIIYDAPVLQYYSAHEGLGRVHVAGPMFHPEKYGIALRPDSPLRKPINREILLMFQDGAFDELYGWWFGAGELPR
jgi:ABC-type amino acid transport substrate-binding protein